MNGIVECFIYSKIKNLQQMKAQQAAWIIVGIVIIVGLFSFLTSWPLMPQMPPTALYPTEYSIYDTLAEEWSKMSSEGVILFNPPKQMEEGKEERVEARIGRNATTLLAEGLRGKGEPETQNITVFPIMAAELRGDNFRIEELSPKMQLTNVDEYAQWSWDVTPLDDGNQTLLLLISAVIIVPGSNEVQKQVPILEWPVEVKVNYRYKAMTFLSSNWQWLVSFVFGTLFGTGLARRKK